MTPKTVERKLVAILAADVAGYSQMMFDDELDTISRLKNILSDVFRPSIKRHGGRIFKTMGDGALVEFASVNNAVQAAVEVQRLLSEVETDEDVADPIRLRLGVSLGDVVVEGSDLFGNGVNIASRMESLAEPGTICVSGNVREHVREGADYRFVSLGPCEVKNIPSPIEVYQVQLHPTVKATQSTKVSMEQNIRFCTTTDGFQIAYSTLGEGPPIVIVSNWLTHLELDFQMPVRRAMIEMLAQDHRVVRYDARGSGLSERNVDEFSLEASLTDLTTVINELGLKEVSFVGQSQGAAIAALFAARNPEMVKKLVFSGGYARGRRMRGSEGQVAESDAFITMIREGWGKELDSYVRMFGAFFMPDANTDQLAAFTNLQRKATPPENAARIQLAIDSIDISDELANVIAPTLVLHVREDARAPFDEGRRLAAGIPNARFVPLEGRNHFLLASDPSFKRYLNEVRLFFTE